MAKGILRPVSCSAELSLCSKEGPSLSCARGGSLHAWHTLQGKKKSKLSSLGKRLLTKGGPKRR